MGPYLGTCEEDIAVASHPLGEIHVNLLVLHGRDCLHSLHEDPHLPNHGPPGRGPHLRAGHVLAIEPIFSLGQPGIVVDEDGWTARTRDGSLAAHFEHTVAVTEDGPSLLTLSPGIADTADSCPVCNQPPGGAEAPPEKAEDRG